MKYCTYITFLLFYSVISFGQVIERQNNETAKQFAERQKPDNSSLTHKVLETNWNSLPVIIAFYDQVYKPNCSEQAYHRIVGTVFIKLDNNSYRKTTLEAIDSEGGDPHIESVFFANTDKDKTNELIIIASWYQRHYFVMGTLYGTFVFDRELASTALEWQLLEQISKKLDGGCDCTWEDGKSKKAKFTTASEIKKKLIRLGYKQHNN